MIKKMIFMGAGMVMTVYGNLCHVVAQNVDDCPSVKTVRIQDYGGVDNGVNKPTRYLRDNAGIPEWAAAADDHSAWYEIPVEGSTVDFYYKNVGSDKYLYRESTGKISTACDWQPENALLGESNPKTAFYQFRKIASTWGNRFWLANMADANVNGLTSKGAFILSGINKNHTSCGMPDYPAVVMTAIPNNSNVWSSVTFETVSANVADPDCQSTCDINITLHPKSNQYTIGNNATALSIEATGDGWSYHWYQSVDNTVRTPENDAQVSQNATYTPDISATGRSYYYVKLSNEYCERISNIAIITVNSLPPVSFPNYPEGYPVTMTMQNPLFWQFGSPQVDAAGALIPESRGNLYTADASARVWNIDKEEVLYVYASHDMEQGAGCDRMDRYHVFSTTDMTNWTDHGEIFNADDVPWHIGSFRNNSKFMWAPDCVYQNGKYYYYFPHPSQNSNDVAGSWGNNWQIGIAVSDHPASDFTILPEWLKGLNNGAQHQIDPSVFIDDDGKAYFYNGGGGRCFGGKLKDNMVEIDGDMQEMTGLVNFHEATWIHKYNGKYYLSYSDNSGGGANNGDQLKYAIGNHPLGPWTDMGVYVYATGNGTIHGSIVQFKGQWYAFYHTDYVSFGGEAGGRSVHVDPLFYNPDGSIQTVNTFGMPYKGVTRTVAQTNSPSDIALVLQAEDFNDGGQTYGYLDRSNTPNSVYRSVTGMAIETRASGYNLGELESKEFTRYTIHVEKAGLYDVDCFVASMNSSGRFHLNVNGVNKSGTVSVTGNGGWGDGGFAKLTVPNVPFSAGVNLFELRIENGGFNIDRFEFRKAQPYAGTPFKEHHAPGKIEAEDFDNGGAGVAYYDTTPANQGGHNYRQGEGVDIENSAGSIHISHTVAGEWLKYTFIIAQSGIYDVKVRVASGNASSGSLSITFDDVYTYPPLSATTDNWSTYAEVTLQGVELTQGAHVMTVTIGGNINIDWYQFDLVSVMSAAAQPELSESETTLYPNPTTGIVYLNKQGEITVYNMQGVKMKTIFGSQIDLSIYPSGIYILKFNNEWKKVIKN